MDTRLRITMLGRLSVRRADAVHDRFSTRKTAALLARLAVPPGTSRRREDLIEMLWPGATPELGRRSLRTALASLRRQLEPPGVAAGSVLRADRSEVGLVPGSVDTDVVQFEAAIARAAEGSVQDREARLRDAAAAYTGPLLPGVEEDWVPPERERLAGLHLQVVRRLVEALRDRGDVVGALEFARAAVRADPLREELHAELIILLHADGQETAARQAWDQFVRVIRVELDAAPSALVRRRLEAALAKPSSLSARTERVAVAGRAVEGPPAPAGTVTLLLLDLAEADDAAVAMALDALPSAGGFPIGPDAGVWGFAFARADAAATAAVRLAAGVPEWQRCRAILFSGDLENSGQGYSGPLLIQAAALMAAAPRGQIMVSEPTAALLEGRLSGDASLVDIGTYRLDHRRTRLYRMLAPDLPLGMAAAPTLPRWLEGSLPAELTRFFGRTTELAHLAELLLRGERLVTLTGTGGTGKTRLALQLATQLRTEFRGALLWVPAADLTDAGLLLGAVLQALGLPRADADPIQAIVAAISDQPWLLLLDNLEQLGPLAGAKVQALLEHNPRLQILATSRVRLAVPGECEYPVGPLPLPDPSAGLEAAAAAPSVALLVDRAQSARPDFQVTPRNLSAIVELIGRLEGLPLAVELAASRAGVLSPAQMLERLTEHPTELSTVRADRPERHRSLRATMEWSFGLLSPPLRQIYSRLSAFRGGWTLQAAEELAVAELTAHLSPLDALGQLRSHSLIQVRDSATETRFLMLESLREFAGECLLPHEADALHRAHAEYYLGLAREVGRCLEGPERRSALDRQAPDLDNARRALLWSQDHDPLLEVQLAAALYRYWRVAGHYREGREWLADALARSAAMAGQSDQIDRHRADALYALGYMHFECSDLELARGCFERSLAERVRLGDPSEQALCHVGLATLHYQTSGYMEALAQFRRAEELVRPLNDIAFLAYLTGAIGQVAYALGELDAADAGFRQAWELSRDAGNLGTAGSLLGCLSKVCLRRGMLDQAWEYQLEAVRLLRRSGSAAVLTNEVVGLALCAVMREDWAAAELHAREALELATGIQNDWSIGCAHRALGSVALGQGDAEAAADRFRRSIRFLEPTGDLSHVVGSAYRLGLAELGRGRAARAVEILTAAARIQGSLGSASLDPHHERLEADLRRASLQLNPAALAEAIEKGQAHDYASLIALTMADGGQQDAAA